MARPSSEPSIDVILRETVDRVVEEVSDAIARQIGVLVHRGIRDELAGRSRVRGRGRRPSGRKPRGEITRWVADSRARRVPNFVIEATDLDTKKKIVAKFGDGAAFEKGKPLPKPRPAAA